MNYWRMQLHPADSDRAMLYAVQCLGAGLIGLDFEEDSGDLLRTPHGGHALPKKDFLDFARRMEIGDWVMIVVHHFPFALARVAGNYNYVREPIEELGVWFRHSRRVSHVTYYPDLVPNAHDWERITMTDTISILIDPDSKSQRLMSWWLDQAGILDHVNSESTENEGTPESDRRLTLHEAMVLVLLHRKYEKSDPTASARELEAAICEGGYYLKRDRKPPSASQIFLRARNYSWLFVVEGDATSCKITLRSAGQWGFNRPG